jgi:hypothetical protein
MKFLITGSIHSARGPRLILTCALVFFLFFTGAHLAREAGSTGLAPDNVVANLYGGETRSLPALDDVREPPPGFLALLEDLHMDLFFFGLVGLFLGAVLYQVRAAPGTKRGLIYALFLFPLGFTCARGLTFFWRPAAWLVLPTAVGTYATIALIVGWILWDLYRTRAETA